MIKLPEKYKALIFDLDGTLADTMPLHYKACQIVCNEKGFDFPEDYFYQEAGKPTIEVFQNLMIKLGKDFDGKILGKAKEKQFLDLISEVTPLKIVADIAQSHKGKIPMAIGSGGQRDSVELTLDVIGYTGFFDSIVSCDDVSNHKPSPETFLKCAEEMGVQAKDCVVFEDGDPGVEAAKAAGMMVIDVRPYFSLLTI
ncbi:MAG: HAD family phosphatase [Flavobacteriales bacterium]|mgnify:FL=1|nr:HAD family phosphatase [Flavobacteriales bacterium]